ncbi:MAG: hypothetical protein WDW38_010963 [Sanguina aurantia]
MDPWDQVEDLDGAALYRALCISRSASSSQVTQAYRALARSAHPDKGGTSERFAALRRAYDTLSDPARRAAYDSCASDVRFNRSAAASMHQRDMHRDQTGQRQRAAHASTFHSIISEGTALSAGSTETDREGAEEIDAATQLVVTCEMCGRPATAECYACTMQICSFCTRDRHWKGAVALHWPVVNSPHMLEKLGRRELEAKRLEDDARSQQSQPHYRDEASLRHIRELSNAHARAQKQGSPAQLQELLMMDLARHYLWKQSQFVIYVACYIPTGRSDLSLDVSLVNNILRVQSAGAPAVLDRRLAMALDPSIPITVQRSPDNRYALVGLPKAKPGPDVGCLFVGDSDGVRCTQAPYSLYQTAEEAVLEVQVPFWIDKDDVSCVVDEAGLKLGVRNNLWLHRTFWKDSRSHIPPLVIPELCSWSLVDGSSSSSTGGSSSSSSSRHGNTAPPTPNVQGETEDHSSSQVLPAGSCHPHKPPLACTLSSTQPVLVTAVPAHRVSSGPRKARPRFRCLMVVLALRPLTQEEVVYKKGVRQDNLVPISGASGRSACLFLEDEDSFGLANLLQGDLGKSSSSDKDALECPAPGIVSALLRLGLEPPSVLS